MANESETPGTDDGASSRGAPRDQPGTTAAPAAVASGEADAVVREAEALQAEVEALAREAEAATAARADTPG